MTLSLFSQTKLEQSVDSSHLHTHRTSNQPHPLLKHPSSPSVSSLRWKSKLLLSSYPTTCPLDPIPSHFLEAISPTLLPELTHIINTSLLTGIFPTAFKQARGNPTSLAGLSGWPGEGRYPKHINWFLDPSSSPNTLHHWVPSYRHMASPTIDTLMTHSSISLFNQMIRR